MKLKDWTTQHPVKDEMIYKLGALHQVERFDSLHQELLTHTPDLTCDVVSYHRSKSIDLPVVRYHSASRQQTLWVRDNFHNLAISLSCEKGIPTSLDRSAWQDDPSYLRRDVYFEGFGEKKRSEELQETPAPFFAETTTQRTSFHLWSMPPFLALMRGLFGPEGAHP